MHALPPHLQAHCPYCGAGITVHQKFQPGHCGSAECHKTHVLKGDEIRLAAWLAQYTSRVDIIARDLSDAVATRATQQGVDPDRVHLAAVPHAKSVLAPLPDDRRRAYLAHLKKITKASFERPLPDAPSLHRDEDAEYAEPHGWNDTACGTCQGYCCEKWAAETFAFQTVEVIDHLRHCTPDMAAEDIVALYESAIPDVTTEGGCVFQGPQGCVLPRDQRADICNTFRCYALRRIVKDFDPEVSDAVAVVSFDHDDTPGRSGFYKT